MRAVQSGPSGTPVAGSDFEIEPFGAADDDFFAPDLVTQFPDGSLGIFAIVGGNEFERLEFRHYSLDSTTKAAVLIDKVVYDYARDDIRLEFINTFGTHLNDDGTTSLLATFDGIAFGPVLMQMVELKFSASGIPLNSANTAPVITNGNFSDFLKLKNGGYAAVERFEQTTPFPEPNISDVQLKFLSGSGFQDSGSVPSNVVGFSDLSTTVGSLFSATLEELADGKIAVAIMMGQIAGGNRIIRHFATVADPAKDGQPDMFGPLVQLGVVVGVSEFPPTLVALDDGSYIVAWVEETVDTNLTPTRVFLQRMGADGVPLSGRIEAGSAGPEVGLSLALLPTGQVQLTTGAIDGTTADADVRVEIFDVTPTIAPPIVQIAEGDSEALFFDVFIEGTQTSTVQAPLEFVSATDPTITGHVFTQGLETDGTALGFGIIGGTVKAFQIYRNGEIVLT